MDPFSFFIIALGLVAGALAKGATGMGLPLIAIPVMAPAIGLPHAMSIMVIPILVTNAWQIWTLRAERHRAELRFLTPMLLIASIGVVIGTWFVASAPERLLTLTLGLLLLAYLVLRLTRPDFRVGPEAARRWALPAGLGAGLLHGATGISAPIGVTFIHAMRLDRSGYVFAISAMFMALTAVQLPSLLVSGVMQSEWLVQGVFALIPIVTLMPIGEWMARKLSRQAFDRVILAFIGLMGLKMALGV